MPKPIQSERFLVSPGLTPEAWTRDDLLGTGPRRDRQHLARGTGAFVPGSAHPEASSFSPVTAHSIAQPRASTIVTHGVRGRRVLGSPHARSCMVRAQMAHDRLDKPPGIGPGAIHTLLRGRMDTQEGERAGRPA
jgi:hypothetical protein